MFEKDLTYDLQTKIPLKFREDGGFRILMVSDIHGPDVVLLVHEAPNCTCAERPVLRQWFKDNGFELTEWSHR